LKDTNKFFNHCVKLAGRHICLELVKEYMYVPNDYEIHMDIVKFFGKVLQFFWNAKIVISIDTNILKKTAQIIL